MTQTPLRILPSEDHPTDRRSLCEVPDRSVGECGPDCVRPQVRDAPHNLAQSRLGRLS